MFERPTTQFQSIYEAYEAEIRELKREIELTENLIEATKGKIDALEESNFTFGGLFRGSNEDKLGRERMNLAMFQDKLNKYVHALVLAKEKKKEASTMVLKEFGPSSDQLEHPH